MLTGSLASSYHGLPRSTQDIDFVIEATPEQLHQFIESLPSQEYFADKDAAIQAHQHHSLFNIIDLVTGWKIDLIMRKPRAFSMEEFRRRRPLNLQEISLPVASAEDIIIAKLEWAKMGQSQRQIEDAAGILKIRSDSVDRGYIERWVQELCLTEQWQGARQLAGLRTP